MRHDSVLGHGGFTCVTCQLGPFVLTYNRKQQIPRYFEKQIRLVMRDVMETEWEEVGNTMGGA